MWPHLLCLGYGGAAETNDHIFGPLMALFSCSAASESVRGLRWMSAALGAWLHIAPFVLGYEREPLVNSLLVGAAVLALALIRGPITQQFGGGWSALWKRTGMETHT